MNKLHEKLLDKCYTDITLEDIKTLINCLDEDVQEQAVEIVLGMVEIPEFKPVIFTKDSTITMIPNSVNLLTKKIQAEVKLNKIKVWVPTNKFQEARDCLENFEFDSYRDVQKRLDCYKIECESYPIQNYSEISVKCNHTKIIQYSFNEWKSLEKKFVNID